MSTTFTMPVNRVIAHYDRTRNTEQRTTSATSSYSAYDADVAKMYPNKSILPQNVRDAIRYNESTTY